MFFRVALGAQSGAGGERERDSIEGEGGSEASACGECAVVEGATGGGESEGELGRSERTRREVSTWSRPGGVALVVGSVSEGSSASTSEVGSVVSR